MLGTNDPEGAAQKDDTLLNTRAGQEAKARWRPKTMNEPWRYFNVLLQGVWAYADDVQIAPDLDDQHEAVADYTYHAESARASTKRKSPSMAVNKQEVCSPHGADGRQPSPTCCDASRRPHSRENTDVPAKSKNPDLAASRRVEDLDFVCSRGVQITRAAKDRANHPIKRPDGPREATVDLRAMDQIAESYRSPSKPRRWLAGAPGGWWPSDINGTTSDEEAMDDFMAKLPLKKRRIQKSSDPEATLRITPGLPSLPFQTSGSQMSEMH
ncbi:hypothetical protein QAD02_005171 [Eretmocerus hayati]|uniref:Uncharacterized protein n=1 Tax=Eretmocerus hayati TaxID=131215 RepID=A0ACC2NUD0_9HYME|nr:hypothetical protein QAD02_005171 [Eretmocerus hayati]